LGEGWGFLCDNTNNSGPETKCRGRSFVRPEPRLWLDLTVYQWSAAAFIPAFVALWIWDRKQFSKSTGEQDLSIPGTA
jgi:hypothetical protein